MQKKGEQDRVIEEIKRHNKVLMEHMEQQVKTVAEQHGSIIRKLEEHDGRFVELEEQFDNLGGRFGKLEGRFDGLESTIGNILKNHEERIEKVEEKVFV